MGLSTHVLDTMHGCPAAGMQVVLWACEKASSSGTVPSRELLRLTLNEDGRAPGGLLMANDALQPGRYRLSFDVASYFRRKQVQLPEIEFLDWVHLDFGVAFADQHYHVPLLVSPWSYSTYRGS